MKDNFKNILKFVKNFIYNFQILSASIILSLAIIIYGILSYNTHRYSLHTGNNLKIFDKNTGEIYWRSGHCNFIKAPNDTEK